MYRSKTKFANYYKRPIYKRRSFYIIIIAISIIIGFISWSIRKADDEQLTEPQITDQKQAPSLDGKIFFISGQTQLKTTTTDWADIKEGESIKATDTIRTTAGARTIIELPDKSYVRLLENSEIKFNELGMTDIVIEQITGTAYHRVNDQSTAIYRVKDGNIELTALGTAFSATKDAGLLKVAVVESRLKVKIYDQTEIINMRTLEAGTRATINPGLAIAQMISSEEVQASTLLENEWYSWNLEKDKEKNFSLGIFEKATKLTISEPTKTEFETDKDKITIKGSTEKDAKILVAGKDVENKDGNFEAVVPLLAGDNKIEILVKKDDNLNKRILTVKSNQQEKKIMLTGERQSQTTVKFTWETININDIKEFKLVRNKEENPTFPASSAKTIANNERTATWDDLEDGKYNFRICALDETGSCVSYSNNLPMLVGEAALWEQVEIKLSAEKIEPSGARLSWTTTKNLDPSVSLKTILTSTSKAVYPGKQNHALLASETTDEWQNLASGTQHFHVCIFQAGQCLKFSNDATVAIATSATPLSLTGSSVGGKINLSWTNNNSESPNGFLSIVSETPNVVFPGKEHHRLTTPTETTDSWSNLVLGKEYFFRVCQNLGGSCGAYSNELSLIVK